MTLDFGYLFGMALQTVPQPRKVARDLFDAGLPSRALWLMLALLLVGSTFLGVIAGILFPAPEGAELPAFMTNPLLQGAVEAAASLVMVWLIYTVGRLLGGQGIFKDALVVICWLHFVLLNIQIGVLAIALFSPGLSGLLALMGGVMSFWILTHFITEMHSFRSAGLVFVGILITFFVVAITLSILLMITGFGDAFVPEMSDV